MLSSRIVDLKDQRLRQLQNLKAAMNASESNNHNILLCRLRDAWKKGASDWGAKSTRAINKLNLEVVDRLFDPWSLVACDCVEETIREVY